MKPRSAITRINDGIKALGRNREGLFFARCIGHGWGGFGMACLMNQRWAAAFWFLVLATVWVNIYADKAPNDKGGNR